MMNFRLRISLWRRLTSLALLCLLAALITLPLFPATSLAANGIPAPRSAATTTPSTLGGRGGAPPNGGPAPLPPPRDASGVPAATVAIMPVPPSPRSPITPPLDPSHTHDACTGTDWHPPTDHEHGDPPPVWIMAAGYNVCFSGAFSTSPLENTAKHAAMKGFSFPNAAGSGQDLYMRVHAASNPGDRSSRYHSYEWWIRGTDGKVSHASGWYDSGDPAPYDPQASPDGGRIDRDLYGDPGLRPVILVTSRGDLCEQWYARPGQADWMADFGWTICQSTTRYTTNENANPDIYNAATWPATGALGVTRRLEFAWYAWRSSLRGDFYTDQFGQLLSGPDDARVGTTVIKFGKGYTVVALKQYIEPTLRTVAFPGANGTGNALQKQYACPEACHAPN